MIASFRVLILTLIFVGASASLAGVETCPKFFKKGEAGGDPLVSFAFYEAVPIHPVFAAEAPRPKGKSFKVFDAQELESARVHFADGQLFDHVGQPLHTEDDETLIFIMDEQGSFYATRMILGQVFHSSLSGGKPVALAGRIRVKNGRLIEMTDYNGHYVFNDDRFLNQGRHSLQSLHGVDTSLVSFQHFSNPLADTQL